MTTTLELRPASAPEQQPPQTPRAKKRSLFDPAIVMPAIVSSIRKLNPIHMVRNPVMFVTEVEALVTTVELFFAKAHGESFAFVLQISLWLWFTVLFANFAEAMAEGRGKAQADALRKGRTRSVANKLRSDGTTESVPAESLRKGDVFVVNAGELIAADAMALARQAVEHPAHTIIGEMEPGKLELVNLLRKTTTRIDISETRRHLTETAGLLERKQQVFRQSGKVKIKPKVDFHALLEQAHQLTQQTKFAEAGAALAEARKAGAPKEELQAYYAQLGLAAFDHGRMDEALAAFQTTRDLGPESVEGWFNCGLVYQKIGELPEALDAYQEAARLAPDNAKIWSNISSVWFEMGNYEEAEKTARSSLALRPDYPRAWDNLAATLSAMNRLAEAAEACQQAIRLQPALQSAWFKLGVIHFQLDNLLASKEAFNLTGDSPELFPFVLYYFSMIEARRGELDAALQKLAEARSADPDNELEPAALKEIAAACTRLGRHVAAADFYEQAAKKQPDDFSAWLALGAALHRGEKFAQAREAYLQAGTLQPDNHLPWHNLGLLAADQNDYEEARRCFEKEIALCPEDAKAWYDLAVSLQNLGLEKESTDAFEHAEELVGSVARRTSDLSAALSIVRRLNLGERIIRE